MHATGETPPGSSTTVATALKTLGADVVVSGATPPVAGQVLTALTPTTCNWQTPSVASGTTYPSTPFMAGSCYMIESRQRQRSLLAGETRQLVAAVIGDSWSDPYTRWCGTFAAALKTTFGDAGIGWIGCYGNNAGIDGLSGQSRTGTWTSTAVGTSITYSVSPNIADIRSSTVGSNVHFAPTNSANSSAVNLYHIAGTAGTLRYRWDSGAWTTLDVGAGTGLTISALIGFPATAWTLDLEVLTGTVILCGIDVKKSTNGVRVHKLGLSSTSTTDWLTPNAAQWELGITALAPDLVIILHGTNDRLTPTATYAANLTALIARVRAARPAADIFIVMPCSSSGGTLVAHAAAAYTAAVTAKAGFLDLQYVFGNAYSEYGLTGTLRVWFSDGSHPDGVYGSRAIADAVIRFLTTA